MKLPPPWFRESWEMAYAKLYAQILKLEALAKAAGRRIRPC